MSKLKLNWNPFVTTERIELELDGENWVLVVTINHFKEEIRITGNNELLLTSKIKPLSKWQSFDFLIGNHSCNYISMSSTGNNNNSDYDYDLIIDEHSITTGEPYEPLNHRHKHSKMYNNYLLKLFTGVIIGGIVWGLILGKFPENKLLEFEFIQPIFIGLGFYVGFKFIDFLSWLKNLRGKYK